MSLLMRPTKEGIVRNDPLGLGHYGAPRKMTSSTGRVVRYLHKGTDYVVTPGDPVFSPVTGKIIRLARPYPSHEYSGVLIESKAAEIKLFYLTPYAHLVGSVVQQGETIGEAEDISLKYPGVTPHIHLEIVSFDPERLMPS